MDKRVLWVIEIYDDENKEWMSTYEVHTSRSAARTSLKVDPKGARVRKYVPED